MVQADSGKVTVFGQDFTENELELKQKIGCMFGGVDYYPKSKLKTITNVVRRFFSDWDNDIYMYYINKFSLDESKKISELSHGMKVKYSLALSLSHHAQLYILDEPTSGLDPVARDELLEVFQELVEDGKKSILFSTHITSDLEKCADFITYIKDGEIIKSSTKDDLINSYRLIKGSLKQLDYTKHDVISYKINSFGFSALIETQKLKPNLELSITEPNLEDIMIYHSRLCKVKMKTNAQLDIEMLKITKEYCP